MIGIKGMEMTKSCAECSFVVDDMCGGATCILLCDEWKDNENHRAENCPLTEIITCKNCKYCEEVHYENEGEPPYVKLKCNSTRNTRFYRVEEDFYCGDGERRE